MALDMRPMFLRAQWSTAFVNSLPDSSFLLITPGGTKTNGRTDGAHRYFPVRDADGKVDSAHLRNALARIPQASDLTPDQRAAAMEKAKKLAAGSSDIGGGKTAQYEGSAGSGRSRPPTRLELPDGALGFQERTFELVMELRSGGDGRTLVGRAVPYGVIADVGRFRERFIPGVFARQVGAMQYGQIKLYDAHSDRLAGRHPIGKTVNLAEQPDGLYGEWKVHDTSAGEDALRLVRAGEVTGLSVGFTAKGAGSRKADDGVLERVAAHLDHVALTHEPVYADAQVLGVRARLPEYEADRERLRALVL